MAESVDFGSSIVLASDEMQARYCAPCNKDGNFVSAEGLCVDCSEYLCGQCYKSHRRFKSMENHVLKDKGSLIVPVDSSREILDECVEKCNNHPGKVVEFFCGTCNFIGCYVCMTVHHRQCEKVVFIPDIVKASETDIDFKDFHKELELIAKRLTDHNEEIQVNIKTNVNMKKLAKDELKTQRAEINKFFDELENKLDVEIENIEKENKRTLKVASDRLQSMEKCFDEMKTSIDLKKNGQQCELFIAMKKCKKVIETLNDGFNKLLDERRITRYTVHPSEQIQAMMKTTTEICRMTVAKIQSKIDISTTQGTETPITGVTGVHRHYCVVSDNRNMSLKVIDIRRKCVVSEIQVDASSLWGLTAVPDDQVAVSVYLSGQTIQFFSVSASGVVTCTAKQFDVQKLCLDLAYNNDKLFLCQMSHILICNTDGQTINKIEHYSAGVPMYNNLSGIVLSQDGGTIYVTDEAKNAVISMTLTGSVKAIYKEKDIKDPWGITVDKRGYLYVRSVDTHTIHQLSADLRKAQIIIDDVFGIVVTCSRTENKLYVGEDNGVCVYDLNNH